MNNDFFKVFKTTQDLRHWEKHVEFATISNEIAEPNKQKFIEAIQFLKSEFGAGFLKQGHRDHPLIQKLSNWAQWQVEDCIVFGENIKLLKTKTVSYPKLKSKLLSAKKAKIEGVPFVEIAVSFLQNGFHVTFLEETNTGKSPDLEIYDPATNQKFYVEISVLEENAHNKIVQDNYLFLNNCFEGGGPFTGIQKRIIKITDYNKIRSFIQSKKEEALGFDRIIKYSDSHLDFWHFPFTHLKDLKEFCTANKLVPFAINALPCNFDEATRLIENDKIRNKSKQIPKGSNGLLYFPLTPLFFLANDLSKVTTQLEEYIQQFKNIIGIVLYSKILNPVEGFEVTENGHMYSRKMMNEVQCRDLLFISNHKCKLVISPETLNSTYNTLK